MVVKVNVRLLGVFHGLSGRNKNLLTLKNPTVRSLIQELAKSLSTEAKCLLVEPEFNASQPNALILVNGTEINILKGLETTLEDGDEVTLIPVSHGG